MTTTIDRLPALTPMGDGLLALRLGDGDSEIAWFVERDHGGWFVTYGTQDDENPLVLDIDGCWVAADYYDLASVDGEEMTTWTYLEVAVEMVLVNNAS